MPRLVAVSKTKPLELIQELYDEGQRHFGENYIQELVEKSTEATMNEKCPDISWHFIGNLQSNKVSKIIKVPNLSVVETVTSAKLADKLNSQWTDKEKKLKIMIQVNTSGEDNKNGLEPSELISVVEHVVKNCQNLEFVGLMTIGDLGHSLASAHSYEDGSPNPDFLLLIKCRKDVAEKLCVDEEALELSMGMSNDFEEAIRMGSTNVRIGSTIFGERQRKNSSPTEEIGKKLQESELK